MATTQTTATTSQGTADGSGTTNQATATVPASGSPAQTAAGGTTTAAPPASTTGGNAAATGASTATPQDGQAPGTVTAAQLELDQPISSTDPEAPNAEGITVLFPQGDALPIVSFSAAQQGLTGNQPAGQEEPDPLQSRTIIRGENDDFLDGGPGFDVIAPGNGNNVALGRAGKDIMLGGDGQDIFGGGSDDDLLIGGGGNDFLFGGIDDDVLVGQAGDDAMWGNDGSDRLLGFQGDDVMVGGAGNDRMFGGNGADLYVFDSGAGLDVIIDWEDGVDKIVLRQNLNGTNITSGADLVSRVSTDAAGDTVIDLGGGNNVSLAGTPATQIDASDFIILA